MSLQQRYDQIFEEHRFASSFRLKILAAWGTVYAALAAVFVWTFVAATTIDWIVPGLGVGMTILFWIGDRRNRPAIRRSKDVGEAIERELELADPQQFFSKLDEGMSHSTAIDIFAMVMIIMLSVATGYLLGTGGKLTG